MKSMQTLLNNYLENNDLDSKLNQYRIFKDWDSIVGERVAENAHPAKIINNVLYVKVQNPSWKTELNFMRNDLLKNINNKTKNKFKNIKII